MRETWKAVVGYEGRYEVSTLGRVRSVAFLRVYTYGTYGTVTERWVPSKMLSLMPIRGCGYVRVTLYKKVKGRVVATATPVHRIVWAAFKGKQPKGMVVRHFDDVKTNNALSNLRLGSHQDNMDDKVRNGNHSHGIKHGMARLTEKDVRKIRKLCAKGLMPKDIAPLFDVAPSTIGWIKRGVTWSHVT